MKKAVMGMVIVLFFFGCGSSDTNSLDINESVPPETNESSIAVNNLGNPMNSLGYYGNEVYFWDQSIVGDWRLFYGDAPWVDYFLYHDGTGVEMGLQLSYGHGIFYGVDEDGMKISFSVDAVSMDRGNVFTCNRFENGCCYFEDNTSESDKRLCKMGSKSLDNDSLPFDNSDQPQNALGYYGENTHYGSQAILKTWGMHLVDDSATSSQENLITLRFRNDGTLSMQGSSIHHAHYGVSLDQNRLYVSSPKYQDYIYYYEIESKRDNGCLETVTITPDANNSHYGLKQLFCAKYDENISLLTEGININQPLNSSGYYGEETLLGHVPIIGKWTLHSMDQNSFEVGSIVITYNFASDGLATIDIPAQGELEYAQYGTNENGTHLYIEGSSRYYLLGEEYSEQCYRQKAIDHLTKEEIAEGFLCKN